MLITSRPRCITKANKNKNKKNIPLPIGLSLFIMGFSVQMYSTHCICWPAIFFYLAWKRLGPFRWNLEGGAVKPRIHDAASCTTRCTAGCTTGCIVYTQL